MSGCADSTSVREKIKMGTRQESGGRIYRAEERNFIRPPKRTKPADLAPFTDKEKAKVIEKEEEKKKRWGTDIHGRSRPFWKRWRGK